MISATLFLFLLGAFVGVEGQRRQLRRGNPSDAQLIAKSKESMSDMREMVEDPGWIYIQKDDLTGIQIYDLNVTRNGDTRLVHKLTVGLSLSLKSGGAYFLRADEQSTSPRSFLLGILQKSERDGRLESSHYLLQSYSGIISFISMITITIFYTYQSLDRRTRIIFQETQPQGESTSNSSVGRAIHPTLFIVLHYSSHAAALPLPRREYLIVDRLEVEVVDKRLVYTLSYTGIDYEHPDIPKQDDPLVVR